MKALIIEDEIIFRRKLGELLKRVCDQGNVETEIFHAQTKQEAINQLSKNNYDIAFFDLNLDGQLEGMELLDGYAKKVTFPVVLSSFYDDREVVARAYDRGAEDFLRKPFTEQSIKLVLDKYHYHVNNADFISEIQRKFITEDEDTIKELQKIKFKKLGSTPIHVTGETGTGKEVVAQLIKEVNFANDKPLVAVNCNNFSSELFESHLFGHVKGAFTGAVTSKQGCAMEANGGVLFLDEIDKIPEAIQDKLLRFIETQTFRPVGSAQDVKVELLIVSAGSQDLNRLTEQGKFRRDLKARLSGTVINLKPVRERKGDIPLLLDHFMKNHAGSGRVVSITDQAKEILVNYTWPENAREIKNFVESQLLSDTKKITATKLRNYQISAKATQLSDKYQILNMDLLAQLQRQGGLTSFLNLLQAEIADYYFSQTKLKKSKGNHNQARRNLKIATRAYYRIWNMAKERFKHE